MVPKFSRRPADWLAAMPSARRVCSISSFISRAAPAAGADSADRAGGMKAVIVMSRIDRFGDFGLHFHRDLVGGQHVEARAAVAFAQREHGRQCRCSGVREQSIDPIFRDGELRIVVIIGVHRDSVGKCSKTRWKFEIRADHGAAASRTAERFEIMRSNRPDSAALPASARPRPSRIERLPSRVTSAGISWFRVSTMNSATRRVRDVSAGMRRFPYEKAGLIP